MDLRSMLNEGAAPRGAQSSTPSKPPPQPPLPSTPIQAAPPQPFRDYGQSSQASPGRPMPNDYGHQPPFASPQQAYPPSVGPYRQAPPPLQPLSNMDMRSASMSSVPGPSPYRQTPTSSMSAVSGGYPFPPQSQPHPTPTSPVQRHQYPPPGAYPPRDPRDVRDPRDPRESFSQPQSTGPGGMTGPPSHPSYMQQGPPMPQTPPIGTPGGAHPFLHQRSQSTHSTPTPTSAQSQQHYGVPYGQASPVLTHHPPPQPHEPMRHLSQPPTPLGPPMPTGQRPSMATANYPPQPVSPYQQRVPSTAIPYSHMSHTSPPPPPPPSIPRLPSGHSVYDQQASDLHRRSQSNSERDQSLSVSPKTRLPSLPNSAGHPPRMKSESDPRHVPSISAAPMSEHGRGRAVTPAKRKLEVEEVGRQEGWPHPGERVNGSHAYPTAPRSSAASVSPTQPRRKRPRLNAEPARWAREFTGESLNKANFVVRKGEHAHVNGHAKTTSLSIPIANTSRHTSPEASRSGTVPVSSALDAILAQLGAWEETITGERPAEAIPKRVADFLFFNVVNFPDMGDVQSHGVEFEIEAKLGTLYSKDTNSRVSPPVLTECVLVDTGRTFFKSSMTEDQHKSFNELLNSFVVASHPQHQSNVGRKRPRVMVQYAHHRQVDKFFELSKDMQMRLPASVRNHISFRSNPRVRVTYDQKSNEVLAKIVKARVSDLDIHFPESDLDCRISVNLEMAWDGPVDELEQMVSTSNRDRAPDRSKDRVSYKHSHYQIDLTQVTQTSGPNAQRIDKEHELEIELSPNMLLDQGRRAARGEPHAYQELVTGLVDNIRILAKQAPLTGPE